MSAVVTFTSSGRTDEQAVNASSATIDSTLDEARLSSRQPREVMFAEGLIEGLCLGASFKLHLFLFGEFALEFSMRFFPLLERPSLGSPACLFYFNGELCG